MTFGRNQKKKEERSCGFHLSPGLRRKKGRKGNLGLANILKRDKEGKKKKKRRGGKERDIPVPFAPRNCCTKRKGKKEKKEEKWNPADRRRIKER